MIDKRPEALEASDWTESNGNGMRVRRAYLPASDPRSFQSLWRAQGGGDLDVDIPDWRAQIGLEPDERESASWLIPVPYLVALDQAVHRLEALHHMIENTDATPAALAWSYKTWHDLADLYEKIKAL